MKPADLVLIGFLIAIPLCFGIVVFSKTGFGPSPRISHTTYSMVGPDRRADRFGLSGRPAVGPYQTVKIRVSGHPERNMEFSGNIQPGQVTVDGWIGNSTIEIGKDGKARFISSPCPNKVCVKDGWIGSSSVSVCVPNGVILEVLGHSSLLDGVSR